MTKILPFEDSQDLLPLGDENDPDLGAELLGDELARPKGERTGKITDKDEVRIEGILNARLLDIPLRRICRAYRVSPHTVAALEHRHSVKMATLKSRLARKFGVFLELGLDRAIQEVSKMDRDKLFVSLGISAEKLQLLTDAPTMIAGTQLMDTRRFSVEGLRERLMKPAEKVYDLPGTGSAGEEKQQMRAAASQAPAELAVADKGSGKATV